MNKTIYRKELEKFLKKGSTSVEEKAKFQEKQRKLVEDGKQKTLK